LHRHRPITERRSTRSSNGTTTISTRSIRCCSAPRKCGSRVRRQDGRFMPAAWRPTSWPRRCTRRDEMHVIILSAESGWYTDELSRALADRQHTSQTVPYDSLVARLGGAAEASLSSERTAVLRADAVLARIIPIGSLDQIIYRVDALHWVEGRGIPVVNSPRA